MLKTNETIEKPQQRYRRWGNQMEMLELKNAISKIKSSADRLNSRMENTEGKKSGNWKIEY